MPKKGQSEEQTILRGFRQAEAGTGVSEICREYGIKSAGHSDASVRTRSERLFTSAIRSSLGSGDLIAQRHRLQQQLSAGSAFASGDREHSACLNRHHVWLSSSLRIYQQFVRIKFGAGYARKVAALRARNRTGV
jgi:hypothetical protein